MTEISKHKWFRWHHLMSAAIISAAIILLTLAISQRFVPTRFAQQKTGKEQRSDQATRAGAMQPIDQDAVHALFQRWRFKDRVFDNNQILDYSTVWLPDGPVCFIDVAMKDDTAIIDYISIEGPWCGNASLMAIESLQDIRPIRGFKFCCSQNGYTEEVFARIGELTQLEKLVLPTDRANAAKIESLAGLSNLTSLRLCGLDDTTVGLIVRQHPLLQEITTDSNQSGIGDAAAIDLATLQHLTKLEIVGSAIGPRGVKALCSRKGLTSLCLADSSAGNEACKYLSKLPALTELILSGSQVTDPGCIHLSRLENLSHLSLSRTMVGNAGLRALGSMRNLDSLVLQDTAITREGLMEYGAELTVPFLSISRSLFSTQDEAAGRRLDLHGFFRKYLPNVKKISVCTDGGCSTYIK